MGLLARLLAWLGFAERAAALAKDVGPELVELVEGDREDTQPAVPWLVVEEQRRQQKSGAENYRQPTPRPPALPPPPSLAPAKMSRVVRVPPRPPRKH